MDALPTCRTTRILEHALRMLEARARAPGRLADIPCGTGYLSVRAAQQGWEVFPFDLDPTVWQGGAVARATAVDLNAPLDIEDDAFDALVCCEGLEHLENPWLALREFHRIVRTGGRVVITLPNTIDVRQRLRVLRHGFYGHYLPKVADHINLLGTFGLCHALLRSGFAIDGIDSPNVYGGPVMRSLAALLRFGRRSQLPDAVRSMLSSPRVLCGRTVAVCARVESGAR
ncbi:MAG: class I SAM-dependent methyltransferase [Myxococcales bacterium]|nr:class I SAM-dependent methyltransferase [Myxococcales bacterium]